MFALAIIIWATLFLLLPIALKFGWRTNEALRRLSIERAVKMRAEERGETYEINKSKYEPYYLRWVSERKELGCYAGTWGVGMYAVAVVTGDSVYAWLSGLCGRGHYAFDLIVMVAVLLAYAFVLKWRYCTFAFVEDDEELPKALLGWSYAIGFALVIVPWTLSLPHGNS